MLILKSAVTYFLSFKPYVMLPFIIFIFAMIFKIKIEIAVRSAFTIGIGFLGIFIIFDYFAKIITPVVEALVKNAGLNFNMVDLGWPPLAGITWSFQLSSVMILLVMAVNVLLLTLKITKTVNIDLWNYWHFIFISALVYDTTGSIFISIIAGLTASIITLKLSDWSAPMVHKFSGMDGIGIPTLSAVSYFPIGVVGNKILDKIPGINRIDANPEKIKKKLGLAGEPIIIGFIMGSFLGIGGGYDIKQILDLAIGVSAVIYILPKMSEIVGTALIPISEGMKEFIQNRFPNMGETYIALDVAVLVGQPAVVVTAILLMPFAILFAFVLPGVKFIPVGDLANIMGAVPLIAVATRGNVFRTFIIYISILIGNLYVASNMGFFYTRLAQHVNFHIANYNGAFTSLLDGGNLFRFWIIKVFSANWIAIAFLPVVFFILFLTRKLSLANRNE